MVRSIETPAAESQGARRGPGRSRGRPLAAWSISRSRKVKRGRSSKSARALMQASLAQSSPAYEAAGSTRAAQYSRSRAVKTARLPSSEPFALSSASDCKSLPTRSAGGRGAGGQAAEVGALQIVDRLEPEPGRLGDGLEHAAHLLRLEVFGAN